MGMLPEDRRRGHNLRPSERILDRTHHGRGLPNLAVEYVQHRVRGQRLVIPLRRRGAQHRPHYDVIELDALDAF